MSLPRGVSLHATEEDKIRHEAGHVILPLRVFAKKTGHFSYELCNCLLSFMDGNS